MIFIDAIKMKGAFNPETKEAMAKAVRRFCPLWILNPDLISVFDNLASLNIITIIPDASAAIMSQ